MKLFLTALLMSFSASAFAYDSYIVTCESENRQEEFCPTSGRVIDVQLVNQLSGTRCVEGRNWEFDRQGIYVTGGCRAQFRVFIRGTGGGGAQIVCESHDRRLNECDAGGRIADVGVERVLSTSSCVKGRSWGHGRNTIWVDNGCRAIFRVHYR
ncbi:MAG TPA: DUF3011 domain-containing protein [Bdellovibrionales bacterium]|nr:DUF3011 domain-containing protein [Bdellovibrionales bacterium]